ncbi:hypothetical protein ABIB82_002151 [Bradyrhizobium sp. i1.8.4]
MLTLIMIARLDEVDPKVWFADASWSSRNPACTNCSRGSGKPKTPQRAKPSETVVIITAGNDYPRAAIPQYSVPSRSW